MIKNILIVLINLLFIFSCSQEKKKKEDLASLVNEWQGKEIVFPTNMIFTTYAKDTIPSEITTGNYKILVYVDSTGCTSCKLQLHKWKELIADVDSITNKTVSFLFFFQSSNLREIRYLLKTDKFEYPVCIDTKDELNQLNHFPSETMFQTLLLDKQNKVILIGNPVHNLSVRDLYLSQITGKKDPSIKQGYTTVQIEDTEVNFGNINKGEMKKAIFTLRNTGKEPLVIINTATTCGCAVVSFDKEPALPGNSLQVYVEMTPKNSGFFDEPITVKTNTAQQIRLNIKGQAK